MTRDLSGLLRPRSIAVLGGGWAANVIEQCRRMGFSGDVWPVHPTRAVIAGQPAFASLDALPAPPDATFIGVNRHATLDVVAQLARQGAGGAVAFASGWAETGDGDLQADLVARAGDMPVLGPNCYGLINYLDGALLWPDQHGGRRVDSGVAIISQSSNIAINLTMQARGLPIGYVACLGNAAQTGLAPLGAALLDDPRVSALGLYVEGIDDAPAFAALVQAARAAGKGVVALKAGQSEAGAQAAISHTAALTGDAAASAAFLRQCGAARVDTPAELLETLKILHVHGPLHGRRLVSLSCSGGEAGLVADLAARRDLVFDAPSPPVAQRAQELLGPLVTISNPLDYHTFIWGDGPRTTDVFTTMLAEHDAGLFLIDPPRPDRCDPASFEHALDAIVAAGRATGKPAFPCAGLPENMPEPLADRLMQQGVAPLCGVETALAALEAAATPPGPQGWAPLRPQPPRAGRVLDEAEGKALLAAAGIAVPRGVSAADLTTLAQQSAGLAPPFALKGLGVAHKSEAGAVRLNLDTLAGQACMHGVTGYLAEEMVTGVHAEMLLGLRRDPVYGATLTLGPGGVTAELLADTVTLVLPVSGPDIACALRRLRLWPLLDGYRGRPKPDLAAFSRLAVALCELFTARPDILEIEINPLMLRADDAVAADALITMEAP